MMPAELLDEIGRSFGPGRQAGGAGDAPTGEADAYRAGIGITRIRPQTLILIRWITIAGQLATILSVYYTLDFALPLMPMLVVVSLAAGVNLAATAGARVRPRLRERGAAFFLGFDVVQVAALLSLSGGLENPFAVLLLAPLIVSATIVGRVWTIALVMLVLVVVALLAIFHLPLPGPGLAPGADPIYQGAVWFALSLSALFISWYVGMVTAETQRSREALEAARLALARERQVSSLGALAAAAAHELGTPLGTISLVATELSHDLPEDSPFREDVELLRAQAERCRAILADLSRSPERSEGHPYDRMPVGRLVQIAAAPHRRSGIRLVLSRRALDNSAEPSVIRSNDLVRGLGNILQNGFQFARSEVRVDVLWDRAEIRVEIADDGPGIPSALVASLGQPLTPRSGSAPPGRRGQHLGLGVFIAVSLLEQSGGSVVFGNRPEGGARIVVRWPRPTLVAEGSER